MIMAPVGSSFIVSGSSIAMVAEGPRPGRTPITVPSTTPRMHMPSEAGVVATWKPWRRPVRMSMALAAPSEEEARGQAEVEQVREEAVEGRCAAHGERQRFRVRAPRHVRDDEPREERERDQI